MGSLLRNRRISNAFSLACEFDLHILVPWCVVSLKNFSQDSQIRLKPPSAIDYYENCYYMKGKILFRSDRSWSNFSLSGKANRSKYWCSWPCPKRKDVCHLLKNFGIIGNHKEFINMKWLCLNWSNWLKYVVKSLSCPHLRHFEQSQNLPKFNENWGFGHVKLL